MRLTLSPVLALLVVLLAAVAPASAPAQQRAPGDGEVIVEGLPGGVEALEGEPAWWLEGDPKVPAPLSGPLPSAPRGRDPKVPHGRLIASTARRRGVPVALMTALVWQESGFNARARSYAGARGLTQLMPATARMLGVRRIYDPAQNLDGGARYLRSQLQVFRGSKRLALAAYNAGPGAVRRFGGVPPYAETRNYVKRVLSREKQLRRAGVR